MKKIITIFLAIFFISTSSNSNENEIRLNNLFEKLKIQNHSIAIDTEMKIWDIWTKHPTNQNLTSLLSRGTKFMNQEQYSIAVDIFTTVIKKDPAWAEASAQAGSFLITVVNISTAIEYCSWFINFVPLDSKEVKF